MRFLLILFVVFIGCKEDSKTSRPTEDSFLSDSSLTDSSLELDSTLLDLELDASEVVDLELSDSIIPVDM